MVNHSCEAHGQEADLESAVSERSPSSTDKVKLACLETATVP